MNQAAPNTTWTPDHVQRLLDLREQGLSCMAIASEMGLTENQVAGRLSRMGILGGMKNRVQRLAQYCPGAALPPLRRGRTSWVWTADRDALLVRLRLKGLSFRKIAVIMGVSASTATKRMRTLGLKLPPTSTRRTLSVFDGASSTWMRRNTSWRRVDGMG